jgi:hypothetical protein
VESQLILMFIHIFCLLEANFTEIPGSLSYSRLRHTIKKKTKNPLIAWMTGAGILICELDMIALAKMQLTSNSYEIKRLITDKTSQIIA